MNPSNQTFQQLVNSYTDILMVFDELLEKVDNGEYYLTGDEYDFIDCQVGNFLADLGDYPQFLNIVNRDQPNA
jgi:hypothetical protein